MPSGQNYQPVASGQWTTPRLLESIQACLIVAINANLGTTPPYPVSPTYQAASSTEQTEVWFYSSIQNLLVFYIQQKGVSTVPVSLLVPLSASKETENGMLSSIQNLLYYNNLAYSLNPMPQTETYQPVRSGLWTNSDLLVSIQNLFRYWAVNLGATLPNTPTYQPFFFGQVTEAQSLLSIQNIMTKPPLA